MSEPADLDSEPTWHAVKRISLALGSAARSRP
jgi:hypothetical protein